MHYVTRWNLEKEKPAAEKSPAQAADHLLDRADGSPAVPAIRARGHPGMEQGLRESRFHRRHPGPRSAVRRRIRPGRHPLQHLPLDHHLGRIRHGAVADQSQDGRNPRRRHHLRRRHDPLLAAGIHRAGRHPRGMAMLLAGQRQGFFKLFAAELPAVRRTPQPRWIACSTRIATCSWSGCSLAALAEPLRRLGPAGCPRCQMGPGMQRQLAVLAAVLAAKGELDPGGKVPRSSSPRRSRKW